MTSQPENRQPPTVRDKKQPTIWKARPVKNGWRLAVSGLSLFLLLLSGCTRYFYYPNRVLYADPIALKLDHELVDYPSLNGKKLYAVRFKTATQPPKGTIIHFHGNFANLSNHFPASWFMTRWGYDVVVFDYQGYGGSEGTPSPKNTVDDGVATVRYFFNNRRDKQDGILIFGQSLGGAVGIVVASQEPLVKAMIVESAFSSYRGMARAVLARHWFTWPLAWISPLFINNTYAAERYVAKISPKPLLFIYGTGDEIVPYQQTQKLFELAKEPKQAVSIDGARHMQCRSKGGKTYEDSIRSFLESAFPDPK